MLGSSLASKTRRNAGDGEGRRAEVAGFGVDFYGLLRMCWVATRLVDGSHGPIEDV
jgi:hypothetical protein